MTPTTALQALIAAADDMLAGWKYIRSFHGDLYGVGWDRAQNSMEAALPAAREAYFAALSAPAQDAQAEPEKATTEHDIQENGVSSHNGEHWYKCRKCGASDWIASYGTLDQLCFFSSRCAARTQPATHARSGVTVIGEGCGYYAWDAYDGRVVVSQQSPGGAEWRRRVPCSIYMHAGIDTPPAAPQAAQHAGMVPLTDEQRRDFVKESGLDWHRGYAPLFDGDDTNRFAVLIEAVERHHGITPAATKEQSK